MSNPKKYTDKQYNNRILKNRQILVVKELESMKKRIKVTLEKHLKKSSLVNKKNTIQESIVSIEEFVRLQLNGLESE